MYVLLEDGVVLGAGTHREVCEEIADRRVGEGWSAWVDDGGARRRTHRVDSGAVRNESEQQIVRVPLAGYTPPRSYHASGWARDITTSPALVDFFKRFRPPIATPDLPETFDIGRMREVIHELHEKGTHVDAVKVGEGPAWSWLKAGLDKLPRYPSSRLMPDSHTAAMIWGLPVVLDPNVPEDEIHMGGVVFIVGHDGGLVPTGQVVRIDQGEMRRIVRENFERDLRKHLRLGRDDPGFTNPPSRD